MNTKNTSIEKCPTIFFDYPDSQTNKMRPRYVKAIQISADYIKGNELDFPGSSKEGQFKCYLRNRIACNQPVVISF